MSTSGGLTLVCRCDCNDEEETRVGSNDGRRTLALVLTAVVLGRLLCASVSSSGGGAAVMRRLRMAGADDRDSRAPCDVIARRLGGGR